MDYTTVVWLYLVPAVRKHVVFFIQEKNVLNNLSHKNVWNPRTGFIDLSTMNHSEKKKKNEKCQYEKYASIDDLAKYTCLLTRTVFYIFQIESCEFSPGVFYWVFPISSRDSVSEMRVDEFKKLKTVVRLLPSEVWKKNYFHAKNVAGTQNCNSRRNSNFMR